MNVSLYLQLIDNVIDINKHNNNIKKKRNNNNNNYNNDDSNNNDDDYAIIRISIPAIDVCPPSESATSQHKVPVSDSISNLLSKNVDVRGLTISISRYENREYKKKRNKISSIYSNINYSNIDNYNNDSNYNYNNDNNNHNNNDNKNNYNNNNNNNNNNNRMDRFNENEQKERNYIPNATEFSFTIDSPLRDVLLNPVHIGISAHVSSLSQGGRIRTNSSSTEKTSISEHQLSLKIELGNVEFSPTVQQLYLLSDAISTLRLERVRARLSMFRPKGILLGNARKWWRYAFHAVRELLSERQR